MMRLPEKINKYVENLEYRYDNIGCSEDKTVLFENKYVLKISSNIEFLKREYDLFDFISSKIHGSKPLEFIIEEDKAYLLRTYIAGDILIADRILCNPNLVIEILVKAINILKSLDDYNCPYNALESDGVDFIHGDLCLPNILVNSQNEVVGFIDVSAGGKGDRWFDYAWMLWSFEYNLKTKKYNDSLLKALGIEFDEEKYNLYIPVEYRS